MTTDDFADALLSIALYAAAFVGLKLFVTFAPLFVF